ncbi:hypothetical protein IP81_05245 [Novosphingobium sp. AAP83]|nr:hypothetical protein IP81_05245 [Novosphingobium sp. AAP83]
MNEVAGAVRRFDTFTPENNPYGKHYCASLVMAGHRIIGKIEYYPPNYAGNDPHLADDPFAKRAMTIMLNKKSQSILCTNY